MDDDDIYEQERLANIQRNQELLKELDLYNEDVQRNHRNEGKRQRPRLKSGTSKNEPSMKKKREEPERVQPRRASSRLLGIEADSEVMHKRLEQEAEAARQVAEAARRARHEDHDLVHLTGGDLGNEELSHLQKTLSQTTSSKLTLASDLLEDSKELAREAQNREKAKHSKHGELRSVLDKMQLRSADKVTSKRVYSMVFHPSLEKDLVFVGDKEGNVGVWEPMAETGTGSRTSNGDDGDDNEEEQGGTVPSGRSWNLQVHGRSPVTCLRFDPISANTLYSSSYDTTIRAQNLITGMSTEVWAGSEDVLLSIFDILAPQSHPSAFLPTPHAMLDERSMWIADHRGGISHVDLRQAVGASTKKQNTRSSSSSSSATPSLPTKRWQVCEKKIGGMSINPVTASCISVASLDQHVRLFDVRKLQTLIETTDEAPYNYRGVDVESLEMTEKKAQMAKHQARLACTSVDWDPSGKKLVGVSYDDVVKVWDVDPRWLKSAPLSLTSNGKAKGVKKEGATSKASPRGIRKYFARKVNDKAKEEKDEEEDEEDAKEEQEEDAPSRPDDMLQSPIKIPHNNQTGKWLTLFRARFNANPTLEPHFSIGSMKRHAEIWSGEDGTLLKSFYDPDNMTAVPAVTATHPRRAGVLCTGNASGRATFWAPLDH